MPTIKLADGTEIDAETGAVLHEDDDDDVDERFVEVPTHYETQKQLSSVRRTLNDLPDAPERMNTISLIAMYHLFGLSDSEISIATGISTTQVGAIKMRDAFGDMIAAVSKSVVENDAADVRTMLANASQGAARRIISHINSRDSAVSMAASKDVLDRAGHRPADVVEHRHKVEGGLTIEYVKREKNDDSLPMIDVTPMEDE